MGWGKSCSEAKARHRKHRWSFLVTSDFPRRISSKPLFDPSLHKHLGAFFVLVNKTQLLMQWSKQQATDMGCSWSCLQSWHPKKGAVPAHQTTGKKNPLYSARATFTEVLESGAISSFTSRHPTVSQETSGISAVWAAKKRGVAWPWDCGPANTIPNDALTRSNFCRYIRIPPTETSLNQSYHKFYPNYRKNISNVWVQILI